MTLIQGIVELRPVKGYKSTWVMDERELNIHRLGHSIAEAKQLQADLKQRAAELSKLLKRAAANQAARDKERKNRAVQIRTLPAFFASLLEAHEFKTIYRQPFAQCQRGRSPAVVFTGGSRY